MCKIVERSTKIVMSKPACKVCVYVYRVLFIFKVKYLFFIKDMYRGFGEKNSALNFIFNLLC